MKIMFVCTGNTCRSSMAAGLAKALLKERGIDGIEILSAGTATWSGLPAAEHAVQALADKNMDLKDHQSTMLSQQLVDQADLILTMTANHKQQVLQIAPAAVHKVFTLCEYVRETGDIPDPYGQPLPVYQACAQKLEQLIQKVLDKLLRNAGK